MLTKQINLVLIGSFLLLILLLGYRATNKNDSVVLAEVPNIAQDPPAANEVVRVYYDDPADINLLAEFDLFEYNNVKEQYVLVAASPSEQRTINSLGFQTAVDEAATADFNHGARSLGPQLSGIPGYSCYRTVEETFTTAQDIVTNYPDLATWNDIGNSWEKETIGGNDGYDMMVLKLTNSTVTGTKPKLFAMSAVHAREYTTAELNTRFAELLVSQYGLDADITWLLDYHEIHLLLQSNPDGRKQAETGISWRKNTNENYCSPTSNNRGTDLNRNFEFLWGCCNGSSSSQCSATYRGPSAASEPEVQAIQDYVRSIYPDQRGPDLGDAAPADATGIFLDIHSYSELVLWPWGWGATVAPNGTALQTLGRKFAHFNGYKPEQAIGLYATDGTTDDFAYGELGLPAYTFELGTSFFQACNTFENTILPTNMPALLYAAKASRYPYQQPAGPDVTNITLSAGTVTSGALVDVTAVVDDTRFNNSNGTEPTQPITAVEYYIDVPDWDTANNPVAVAMTAADGSYNSNVETAVATIDTTNLSNGRHTLFIRGQDSSGNWGVVSAEFLYVLDTAVAPHIAGFVREAGTNLPLDATVVTQLASFATTTNPTTGFYEMILPEGSYDLTADAATYNAQTENDIVAANYQQIDQNFYLNISCTTYNSTDVPINIPASGTPTVSSDLIIPDSGAIVDINVLNLKGTHSYMGDIDFNLSSPGSTSVRIMNRSCGSTDNFDLNLDDQAQPGSWPCPPTDSGTYQPSSPLTAFASEEMNGTWRLTINDNANVDGGSLQSWGLEICTQTVSCTPTTPITATGTISVTANNVNLSWGDNVANSGGYEIHRSSTPYFTPSVATTLNAVGAGSDVYPDNGAAGSSVTNYFYTIRAMNCSYEAFADSQQMGEFDFAIQPGS